MVIVGKPIPFQCLLMRFTYLIFLEDHEIFTLVDDLEASEGNDVNFYSWLGLEPTATEEDINRAYRKLSLAVQ